MATVNLISKTGICSGNYKYWANKTECDNWFLNKSFLTVSDASFIRPDSTSKNGYNAACIHIPYNYDEVSVCDYISFQNPSENNRWFHAQVIFREYVNAKSTRLYFAVDYVATYYDTIKTGMSFVERTHVNDDWNTTDFTASKYLLPEPMAADIVLRTELMKFNPLDSVNKEIDGTDVKFNMLTSVKDDGTMNDPEIQFQAGGSISGYINVGDRDKISEIMAKYVTYSTQLITRKDSLLNYLNAIYVAPTLVSENESDSAETEDIICNFEDVFDFGTMYKPRHAKVYDYIRMRFTTLSGSVILKPSEYTFGVYLRVYKTGSPTGCYTLRFMQSEGGIFTNLLKTPTWPAVSATATVKQNEYVANEDYVATAKRMAYGGMTPAGFDANAQF